MWSAEDLNVFVEGKRKDEWLWTLTILVSDWLTDSDVNDATRECKGTGKGPRIDDLRYDELDEGDVLQRLHVGPYDQEAPVLEELRSTVIPGDGLGLTGKHHEIYLSDSRRSKPENLRTVLRQPVIKAEPQRQNPEDPILGTNTSTQPREPRPAAGNVEGARRCRVVPSLAGFRHARR